MYIYTLRYCPSYEVIYFGLARLEPTAQVLK